MSTNIVMICGGKGRRLNLNRPKGFLKIRGKELIS